MCKVRQSFESGPTNCGAISRLRKVDMKANFRLYRTGIVATAIWFELYMLHWLSLAALGASLLFNNFGLVLMFVCLFVLLPQSGYKLLLSTELKNSQTKGFVGEPG